MTTKPKWTQWGKLLLIENPTNPVTQGFEGPVCDKVPRVINLRGKVSWVDFPELGLMLFDFGRGLVGENHDMRGLGLT